VFVASLDMTLSICLQTFVDVMLFTRWHCVLSDLVTCMLTVMCVLLCRNNYSIHTYICIYIYISWGGSVV